MNSGIINNLFYPVFVHAKKFYATDDCISCGKCVNVCPLNNVRIENGKPVWGDHCTPVSYTHLDVYKRQALVFAPDKTVLESLREIMTFDKTKVVPPEYANVCLLYTSGSVGCNRLCCKSWLLK